MICNMAGKPLEQVQRTWSTRAKTSSMGYLFLGIEEMDTESGKPVKADDPPWFIEFTDGQTWMLQDIREETMQDLREGLTR